jgi:hypothetical protein
VASWPSRAVDDTAVRQYCTLNSDSCCNIAITFTIPESIVTGSWSATLQQTFAALGRSNRKLTVKVTGRVVGSEDGIASKNPLRVACAGFELTVRFRRNESRSAHASRRDVSHDSHRQMGPQSPLQSASASRITMAGWGVCEASLV